MDNSVLHLFLCSMIVLMGGAHLASRVGKLHQVTAIDFTIWTSTLYFGFGPWIAYIAGGGTLQHFDSPHLFTAYFGVVLYLLGLLVVQWVARPRHTPGGMVRDERTPGLLSELMYSVMSANPMWFLGAYALVTVVRLILAFQYGIAFSGTATSQRLQYLPYPVVVLQSIILALSAGVVFWTACALWTRALPRPLLLTVLVAESLYLFTQSRRELLGLAVILTFVYAVVKGHLRLKPMLGLAVVGFFLWFWVMPAFYAIRLNLGQRASGDMVASVGRAMVDYFEGRGAGSLDLSYQQNLASRPLIIRFNCNISEYQQTAPPLMGRGLWASFLAVVPSVLFPGGKLVYNSEAFIQREYGVPMRDTSANWPAAGLADFGILGGLVAGLIMGTIIAMGERVAWRLRYKYPLAAFCIAGWLIHTAFQVEQVPETQWNYIRSNILVYLFAALASAVVGGGTEPAPVLSGEAAAEPELSEERDTALPLPI